MVLKLQFPQKLKPLFDPYRFKVLYGGRGSGKSWGVGMMLLLLGSHKRLRILCTREYQTSIKDSVHKLLADQIEAMGLGKFYTVKNDSIIGINGTEFIFKGLHHNITEIKSIEGIDICWIEEAEKVSEESYVVLIPTIRKTGSEIWITFNPNMESDPTYTRFVLNPPKNALVIEMNWKDNPWFPEVLNAERLHDKEHNPDKYLWIWEGKTRRISDAQIFKGRVLVDYFDFENTRLRPYFGVDWGFATDPLAIVKFYIHENKLYIAKEIGGVNIDIPDMSKVFDRVKDIRRYPIYADLARPELISYMQGQGYYIQGAPKWPGSVEDGIEFMKGFDKIVVHPDCLQTINEFNLYSYKTDRQTGQILPIIVDKHNHYIDAIRYGLSEYIKRREIHVPDTDIRRRLAV